MAPPYHHQKTSGKSILLPLWSCNEVPQCLHWRGIRRDQAEGWAFHACWTIRGPNDHVSADDTVTLDAQPPSRKKALLVLPTVKRSLMESQHFHHCPVAIRPPFSNCGVRGDPRGARTSIPPPEGMRRPPSQVPKEGTLDLYFYLAVMKWHYHPSPWQSSATESQLKGSN